MSGCATYQELSVRQSGWDRFWMRPGEGNDQVRYMPETLRGVVTDEGSGAA